MGRFLVEAERVRIRTMVPTDAGALTAYRNDPDVAAYQSWPVPYPAAAAGALVAEMADLGGPTDGEWVQLAIADRATDALLGDVAVHLFDAGRQAEIGYSLATAHQGRGLATDAVGAVVDHLFSRYGVHRVSASLDPDNLASERLLERLGFEIEGIARDAVWHRDRWVDDARWGLTAEGRAAWLGRPRSEPTEVELVEVTPENLRAVLALRVLRSQERLVASNATSMAQVAVPDLDDGETVVAWPRAVRADGELVGFVMLAAPTARRPDWYLWRLMIDRRHQHRHIGQRVLALVVEHVAGAGGSALGVGWVPGPGSPEPFYLAAGFVPTGEVSDGEIVARRSW
jgi:RimJ/RimL family protein N-acetyltransferase